MKVDREAVATLVLPQLWAMSMGPCEHQPNDPMKPMTDVLGILQY